MTQSRGWTPPSSDGPMTRGRGNDEAAELALWDIKDSLRRIAAALEQLRIEPLVIYAQGGPVDPESMARLGKEIRAVIKKGWPDDA